MTKEFESKTNAFLYKVGFSLIFLLPLTWSIYQYGPNLIFFFDKVEGEAEILKINKHKVKYRYFHRELDQVIEITAKINNLKKVKKLKNKKTWKINYLKKYPKRVELVGITNKPELASLFFIMIFFIPLFFLNNLEV